MKTTWRVFLLWMEETADMEGSCEYIEWAVVASRQGAVLQHRVGRGAKKFST